MFIKTAITFILILFTTSALTAKNRKKVVNQDQRVCTIIESYEKGDTLFVKTARHTVGFEECVEKAKSQCSIFSLRVEYTWGSSPEREVECKEKELCPIY